MNLVTRKDPMRRKVLDLYTLNVKVIIDESPESPPPQPESPSPVLPAPIPVGELSPSGSY